MLVEESKDRQCSGRRVELCSVGVQCRAARGGQRGRAVLRSMELQLPFPFPLPSPLLTEAECCAALPLWFFTAQQMSAGRTQPQPMTKKSCSSSLLFDSSSLSQLTTLQQCERQVEMQVTHSQQQQRAGAVELNRGTSTGQHLSLCDVCHRHYRGKGISLRHLPGSLSSASSSPRLSL